MPVLINVSPDKLRPNPWNTNVVSPELEAKLEESVAQLDMFKPIIARELDDGSLEILGGEHRNSIARKRGDLTVPVYNLGTVDDDRAKKISLVDNARYGIDDTLQLGELLKELGDIDQLSTFMPYTEADLASIFAASSIVLDDLDLPDNAGTSPAPIERAAQTHFVMRFKVPVEDVDTVKTLIDGVMKAQKYVDEDALSNAGNALVWLLMKGKK